LVAVTRNLFAAILDRIARLVNSSRRWSRDVTLEQIQTWKTGFLREKVCADPENHVKKRSG